MRRRDFIALLGSATVWLSHVSYAQQPVIGFLVLSLQTRGEELTAFHQGLRETGYIDGQNVAIEYRSAEGRYDRLPELAADLVRRKVSVLVTSNNGAAVAAKAATKKIPIAFAVNDDPVKLGLVGSLARPGGNATGVNFLNSELEAKRLGLLHELVPEADSDCRAD
jgi:putative ABC transport system substrate-binding protein